VTYKKHLPTCYLVSWDDAQIVKAGYTCHRRWRKFTLRGARLLGLATFPNFRDAFALETDLFDLMIQQLPHAFAGIADARPYLGNDGGGHRECFNYAAVGASLLADCERIATASCERTAGASYTNGTHRTHSLR
jgi:hypothetical protein